MHASLNAYTIHVYLLYMTLCVLCIAGSPLSHASICICTIYGYVHVPVRCVKLLALSFGLYTIKIVRSRGTHVGWVGIAKVVTMQK